MKKKNFDPWIGTINERNMSLDKVYRYWRMMLFERLMRLFVWDNLPFPQRELERRLLQSGAVAIVDDAKVGIMCAWASLSGITEYEDVFSLVTYSAPTAKGGTKRVGKGCVYGYNTSTQMSMQRHVDYYASLLAHSYLSIKMSLVNLRAQDILAATDDATRESILAWHKGLYEGKMLAIFDDTLTELPTSIQNISSNNHTVSTLELLEVHNEILRNFYRDIGVRYTKEKRANLVADEVSSDDAMLLYNVDDMLFCRQELTNEYNVFVKPHDMPDAVVKLNPVFTMRESEE